MNIKMRVKDWQLQVKSAIGWVNAVLNSHDICKSSCHGCIFDGECMQKDFDCIEFCRALGADYYFTKPKKKKKKKPSAEFLEALKNVEVGDEVEIRGSDGVRALNGVHHIHSTSSFMGREIVVPNRSGGGNVCYRFDDGKVRDKTRSWGRIVAIRKKSEWIKR